MTQDLGQAENPERDAILPLLVDAYSRQAEEFGHADIRPEDGTLATSLWNAVVIGHPNRFEDMRETAAVAGDLAERLISGGHIPTEARPYAPSMLAAMLRYLWDTQNLMYLDPQFALGEAGVLAVLVADIQQRWSPPREAWSTILLTFPAELDRALQRIDDEPYETVYDILEPSIVRTAGEATALLERIEREQPDALPSSAAYVSGTFIERNSYSPLNGSVPESIGAALTQAYHQLDRDNECRYTRYLQLGFAAVREREPDELDRWRDEDRSSPNRPNE